LNYARSASKVLGFFTLRNPAQAMT